eukprot:UN08892
MILQTYYECRMFFFITLAISVCLFFLVIFFLTSDVNAMD